ncbi:hypothetical protein B0T14DRAFT_87230 [Immersiella caudata]|uniref:Cdc24/Scd1 N-terminal domain-containing protein n=1 Tax=Immersiella caudata TaxID=314043 RepID=A0AA40CDH2_9PEZI|nr:hypothetical protein B0T14DRAFT_87230 [Immersiella caudata]
MDPLSTAASIAGLLSAAVSIGKVLTPYVSAARDTPQVAHHVNAETQSVSIILSALQSLAQNMASVPIQRAALVDVDQVIAVLTSGVFVFSDLEASIGTMTHPDSSSLGRLASLRSRFQWARKETELTALLSRLQSFKSSISLILGILQSDTSLLAEQRQAELAANVHQLLDNNRELSRRLMNLEDSFDARIVATKRHSIAGSIISKVGNERHLLPNDALSSSETSKSPASPQAPFVSGFEFEDEINESGPYRRVQRDTMDFSFRSSIARSHAWSIFSGLSLSNISVMAVIALPIYADEITNSRHYQFGGQRLSMLPFADTSTSPFDDNDSLLRRCLKVQRQLSDLPGFGSVFEHPAPSNHPFKAIQYLFNQGKPLVSLCRCFEQFSVSDRNEELHYYQEQNRAAKNAAYLALKAISESSVFRTQSSEIPTIAEILSSDVVSFLKVVSMIETILALENHVVLPQIDEIQYHSGLNGDSDDFLLLDDFTRRSWKALQHLIGLTSDELVGTFGLLTAVEWQAMFKPILRILGTELRFLLEVEANLLRPVAERQWATAFQIWETRLKDYGHVIGSQPRNSKLLRSRVAGADLPRIQAIGKALDQISFPSRSVEMKSEFFSIALLPVAF